MRSKTLAVLFGLAVLAGCRYSRHRTSHYGPSQVSEYGLPPDAQTTVPTPDALAYQPGTMPTEPTEMPPEKGFVDRHPLLSSPRNYYRDSSRNSVMKVLAGTFVGVPVGVWREGKQIVYGQ